MKRSAREIEALLEELAKPLVHRDAGLARTVVLATRPLLEKARG